MLALGEGWHCLLVVNYYYAVTRDMSELSPIAIKRLRNEGNNIRKLSKEILEQEVQEW